MVMDALKMRKKRGGWVGLLRQFLDLGLYSHKYLIIEFEFNNFSGNFLGTWRTSFLSTGAWMNGCLQAYRGVGEVYVQ